MAVPTTPRGIFTKLHIARQLLREKSEELLTQYMDNIAKMQDAGDFKSASDALKWLIEHIPAEEDGTRIVDRGVDKDSQAQQGPTQPTINIGIAVGGVGRDKALPVAKKPRAIAGEVIK